MLSFPPTLQPSTESHCSCPRPHPRISLHGSRHDAPIILSEDLVRDAEGTLRLLCEALGMPWDPAMLSWQPGPKPEDGAWAPWWYAGSHTSLGFGRHERPEGGAGKRGAPLDPALRPLLEECQALYAVLSRRALRPASARPGNGPPPAAASCHVHRGGTHEYQPDSRNADILVGMRDGVTGAFRGLRMGGRGGGITIWGLQVISRQRSPLAFSCWDFLAPRHRLASASQAASTWCGDRLPQCPCWSLASSWVTGSGRGCAS